MKENCKRVLVVLGEGFEDAEAAVLVSALRWTSYRSNLPDIDVSITGFRPVVRGRFGSSYEIDLPLHEVDAHDFDALVIPGGFKSRGFEEVHAEPVLSLIREMHAAGKPIATLCVGVLALGEAGVLGGVRATTYELSANRDNVSCLAGYGALPTHEEICIDDGVISCTGPVASERVAEALLRALVGEDGTREITRFRTGLQQPASLD